MKPRTSTPMIALSLFAVLALGACGSDEPETSEEPAANDAAVTDEEDTGTSDDADTSDDAATSEDADTESAAEAGAPTIATADTDLGTILVDGEGLTLYLFTNDSPNTSVCEGDCLAAWPILEGEPTAGEGVDQALIGSFERADGTVQATYAQWPLYYFAQDGAPGDVTGQAVGDVWWVLSPEGEAIMDAPAPTNSDGGYGS